MHYSVLIFLSMDFLVEFVAGKRKKKRNEFFLSLQILETISLHFKCYQMRMEWGRGTGEPPWKDFIEEIELRGMDGL